MNLEYGILWPSTAALGPGRRFAIWTQGCPRRCFRCASPELQPFGRGVAEHVGILAGRICATDGIDGITISGGEPMLQAAALARLLGTVRRQRPELNVILFTGFTLDELAGEEQTELLGMVDLLIDGTYVDALNDNRGLRGSSNQSFHFLTPRLLPFKDEIAGGPRRREMHVLSDNELFTIGIADKTPRSS